MSAVCRHAFAHDELLASPLGYVAFLEWIINATRRSHADTIAHFEVPSRSSRSVFWWEEAFSYVIFVVRIYLVRRHADRTVVQRVVQSDQSRQNVDIAR